MPTQEWNRCRMMLLAVGVDGLSLGVILKKENFCGCSGGHSPTQVPFDVNVVILLGRPGSRNRPNRPLAARVAKLVPALFIAATAAGYINWKARRAESVRPHELSSAMYSSKSLLSKLPNATSEGTSN